MTVKLSYLGGAGWQFFDNTGLPLNGGLVYTYAAGTTTPATTYTTSSGLVANSNPIVLDTAGRPPEEIWLTIGSLYKFVIKTSAGVLIATYDNIPAVNDPTDLNDFKAELANTSDPALGDALVGFKQSSPAGLLPDAVARTVHQKLQDIKTLKDFGAVGDGVTDDKTAVQNALSSGFIIDGGGLTYAIDGTCTPTSFVGLQNANFIQIGDNTATNFNTLNIVGFSDFFIDNVNINMGSNVTTLYSDDGNNGLYVAGSAYNSYITNFKITRVTVTGNGCGAGIHVRHAKRFTVDNCLVHDRISGSSPDPTNDSQNGIEIVNAADYVLSNCVVYNLQTRLSGVDSTKWTRGILIVESRDCNIVGCNVTSTDQCYDFSGSYVSATNYVGNRRFVVSGCVANNGGTYGFKFANVARDGLVTGCIANNTSTIAFVCSPAQTPTPVEYNTQNIDFVGCKAVNVLGNGWSSANATGFRVMAGSGAYEYYPRAIRFINCNVIDTQTVPTTTGGFGSDALPVVYPDTGYNTNIANQMIGCTASSNITTYFSGYLGNNFCSLQGTAAQSIPNNTTTVLTWDSELSDLLGLHNNSSNSQYIYIKTPGLYRIETTLVYETNTIGTRYCRLYRNGSGINGGSATMKPVSGIPTEVSAYVTIYCYSGDYIAVYAEQDSGGALDVRKQDSYFAVTKIDG